MEIYLNNSNGFSLAKNYSRDINLSLPTKLAF